MGDKVEPFRLTKETKQWLNNIRSINKVLAMVQNRVPEAVAAGIDPRETMRNLAVAKQQLFQAVPKEPVVDIDQSGPEGEGEAIPLSELAQQGTGGGYERL